MESNIQYTVQSFYSNSKFFLISFPIIIQSAFSSVLQLHLSFCLLFLSISIPASFSIFFEAVESKFASVQFAFQDDLLAVFYSFSIHQAKPLGSLAQFQKFQRNSNGRKIFNWSLEWKVLSLIKFSLSFYQKLLQQVWLHSLFSLIQSLPKEFILTFFFEIDLISMKTSLLSFKSGNLCHFEHDFNFHRAQLMPEKPPAFFSFLLFQQCHLTSEHWKGTFNSLSVKLHAFGITFKFGSVAFLFKAYDICEGVYFFNCRTEKYFPTFILFVKIHNYKVGMDANLCEEVKLVTFSNEKELNWISEIMRQELAEPYSLFTYTNFLTSWPELAVMAYHKDQIVGCIIGSYDTINPKKAYIAMLVVTKEYRRLKVGKKLFDQFYRRVKEAGATKIVLETECINTVALRFYLGLGFFKTRRMLNYYLSGNDAFRLKLYIPENQIKQGEDQKKEASNGVETKN